MKKLQFFKPPLPFIGNKKNFLKDLIPLLENSEEFKKIDTVVDLFWGSWLLSYTIKNNFPDKKVIFNDFDNYSQRLINIKDTEKLRSKIYEITKKYELKHKISDEDRIAIDKLIQEHKDAGLFFDDYSFLSWFSFLWFTKNKTAKYYYNKIPRELDTNILSYLDGLNIVSLDYKELFKLDFDLEKTLFIFDPPYLQTITDTYMHNTWRVGDYLNIIKFLHGKKFIFFSSEKSNTIEFIDFLKEFDINIEYKIKERFNWLGKGEIWYKDLLLYNI